MAAKSSFPPSPRRLQQIQEVVSRTAELLSGELPLSDLFAQLCPMLARFVDASLVYIALRDGDDVPILYLSAGGIVTAPGDPSFNADEIADVVQDGRVILRQRKITRTPAAAGASPSGKEYESAVFVPMKYGRETIGVLCVQSERQSAYDADDALLLESCALFLAVRVHDAKVASEVTRLRSLTTVDYLTGIGNRRALEAQLQMEWRRSAREGAVLSVAMVDVDLFKGFNDRCGHVAGDTCLRQVASALSACLLRPADFLARYGGEEFVAVLPGTGLEGAVVVAERMRESVAARESVHAGSQIGHVSVSAGVASAVPKPGTDAATLIASADRALYRAKLGGRNRVASDSYVSDDAPAAPRLETRTNLPAPLTEFLGRERELTELRELVQKNRLATVVGPGGVGKTRIAVRMGEESMSLYRDGVWFLDLSSLANGSEIGRRLQSALSMPGSPENATVEDLANHLRHRQLLLILDNCEHLLDTCALLARTLLRAAPDVHVLATSRQPLGLRGEAIVRLGGMSSPDAATERVTADGALRYEAVRLFDERARATGQFALTDQNLCHVIDICRRLDGIPLAVELAAAKTAVLGVDAIATRLDERFTLLEGGDRGAPARQQTLWALIAWSFDLLAPQEQALLCRLSVFEDGFSLDDVPEVCLFPGDGAGAASAIHLVTSLADKSLIYVDKQNDEIRYRLLESTREFAAIELRRRSEDAVVAARHAERFAQLAANAERALSTMRWGEYRRALAREHGNLRAALRFTLEGAGAVSVGARLAASLAPWWYEEGLRQEGRTWIERALRSGSGLSPGHRAHLWYALARVHSGDLGGSLRQEALSAIENAVRAFRNLGDNEYLARSLQVRSKFLGIIGEFDDAEQGLREAIELARKIENRNIEAAAYNSLGVIQNYRRRYREAIELHERAAQLFDALGDDFGLSLAINNAADAWLGLGELDKAAAMFRRALTLQERRKNRFQIAFALVNLAEVEVARRNDDVALPALLDALDAIQEYDDSWLLSLAAAQFACILARRGQFDKAAHFLGAAEAARERSGLVWAPTDLMALQEAEKLARSELRSGFEAAVERGKAWTLAETVSAAREVGAQEHFSAEAS